MTDTDRFRIGAPSLETLLLSQGYFPELAHIIGQGQLVRLASSLSEISDADILAASLFLITQKYAPAMVAASGQQRYVDDVATTYALTRMLFRQKSAELPQSTVEPESKSEAGGTHV
jgi:hypothetical protein